jgi:inhibitor of KinA sporulation pathway (predicted exonuclease)
VAKALDQIIVVDVESTCWDGPPPQGEQSEIIEVGLCALNVADGARLERRSVFVRPERSHISQFCTELTTITQSQVDQGVSFAEACRIVAHDYKTRERTWASYGDYDRRQFERQCASFGVAYPFGPTHLNVKNLVALALGLSHEAGMDEALRLWSLPLEGVHHRAGDDAWNIAALLGSALRRLGAPE